MSTRSVVILLIIAMSLAGMVLLFERQVGREVEAGPDEYKVFKAYSKDQVHWVNLVRGDLTVQLVRQAEGWQMNSPVQAEAAGQRVEKLLGRVGELMEVAVPIKGQAGEQINLDQYGLRQPWGKIIVSYGGVASAELSLGQRTRKPSELYARLGKENRVMIIDAAVMELLEEVVADENFYRSRKIFQDKHIAKALSIQLLSRDMGGKKPMVLGKDEAAEQWALKSPLADRANQEAVAKLLGKCGGLRVAEFLEPPTNEGELAKVLQLYGLTDMSRVGVVAVEAEGMQAVVLHMGQLDKGGKLRYALMEKTAVLASSQVFVKIPAEFAQVLPRSSDAFRSRKFLQLASRGLSEVRMKGPEGEIVLGRAESGEASGKAMGQWVIREPREAVADKDVVASFLREVGGLRAKGFGAEAGAEMGFDSPYLSIEVKSSAKGQGGVLEIGARSADGKYRYARLRGETAVRRVDADEAQSLARGSLYFYERNLAAVGQREIKSFNLRIIKTMETEKREVEGLYKEDQWWLMEQGAVRGENDLIRERLGVFDPLHAKRVVAGGVSENDKVALAEYGLDEPRFELTVVQETKQANAGQDDETTAAEMKEYVLLIGNVVEDAQEGEYYGLLRGRDVVFTIGKAAVDGWSDDLRSKKVLPLASWQVGMLSKVDITRGVEELSLEKPVENWQVVAPKKFWPNQDAVKELLGSMATLSGEDFGTDADQKQYGLDEPSMTVSVVLDGLQGGEQKQYRFVVGKAVKGKGYAVKVEDEEIVRLVPAQKLEILQRSYVAYRKKEMMRLKRDSVQAIEIVEGKKRSRAQREQLGWKLTVPAGGALELAKLNAVLALVSSLRAEEVVADTFEQDRKYGLDKPGLVVSIEVVGEEDKKISNTLLIGAKAEGKSESRYARLDGDATVFVLSGDDVEALLKGLVFEPGR